MKSYVKRGQCLGVKWPQVIELCAADPEIRAAFDACVRLSHKDPSVGGRFAFGDAVCKAVYDLFLEATDGSVFGGTPVTTKLRLPRE